MTILRHWVFSIAKLSEDMVHVTFRQIPSNEIIMHYLEKAKQSWTDQGLDGEPPAHIMDHIRQQRFNNDFEMSFPFHMWAKRNLKIGDNVDIDMPLTLDDFKTVEPEIGV